MKNIFDPPVELWGRVGATLHNTGTHCLLPVVLYFRPDPDNKQTIRTAKAIAQWLDSLLSTIRNRCTPILFLDLNSEGSARTVPGEVFGDNQCRKPNINSLEFARILDERFMIAASSHFRHALTFYGTSWQSYIDFVGVPAACRHRISRVSSIILRAIASSSLYPGFAQASL